MPLCREAVLGPSFRTGHGYHNGSALSARFIGLLFGAQARFIRGQRRLVNEPDRNLSNVKMVLSYRLTRPKGRA
jgi:hypothetical protein